MTRDRASDALLASETPGARPRTYTPKDFQASGKPEPYRTTEEERAAIREHNLRVLADQGASPLDAAAFLDMSIEETERAFLALSSTGGREANSEL